MAVGNSSYKNTHGLMNLTSTSQSTLSKVVDSDCHGLKRLYHADNLIVLKDLLSDTSIRGNVQLIILTLLIIPALISKIGIRNLHILTGLPLMNIFLS